MEGGSPQLADPNTVFGLNVFNSIQDQDNRLIYKGFTKLILAGERHMITFEFRCDAPELGRRLIMHISRAETDHGEPCVVFQSQLLEEVRGVSVPLLARQAHGRLDPSWPVIKICSYCQHFSAPQILGRNDWVSPAEYYDSGGIDEVNLSHGICDQCMKRIVEPQIGAVA